MRNHLRNAYVNWRSLHPPAAPNHETAVAGATPRSPPKIWQCSRQFRAPALAPQSSRILDSSIASEFRSACLASVFPFFLLATRTVAQSSDPRASPAAPAEIQLTRLPL